jgi:L-lactate utilization protein LutC
MMREDFLERVRQAVREGNRVGEGAALPERGGIAYQGAGDDAIAGFFAMLQHTGGIGRRVANDAEAVEAVLAILREHGVRAAFVGEHPLIQRLHLRERLVQGGFEALPSGAGHDATREAAFVADVGISGVAWAIGETGSLVLAASAEEPRSLSLLPPLHVALVEASQILPDLFDLFERQSVEAMPAALTLVTGPSKTGDIEMKLVTGVHGPGELRVIVVG